MGTSRVWALALGMAGAFTMAAAVLWRIIPAPRKPTDYLVIGSVSTFAALAVLFGVMLARLGHGAGKDR